MTWQSDVARTICQRLNDAGIGTWNQAGTGGSIVRGTLPVDTCPGIGVQLYRAGADDPQNPTTQVRVQLWLRASTVAALDDLDAAVYDVLHGLQDQDAGAAVITHVISQSSVPMGLDGNGNAERSCNYQVHLDLAPTALRSY